MALEDLLNPLFGEPIVAGKELRYLCPLCGSPHQKLFINNDWTDSHYGQWICFNCGESGNLVRLLIAGTQLSFQDAATLVRDYGIDVSSRNYADELTESENVLAMLNREDNSINARVPLDKVEIPDKPAPPLPTGIKYFRQHYNDPEARPFIEYMAGRGFSLDLLCALNYGYIVDGMAVSDERKNLIHHHVIFFTYNNSGECIYWNTRAIDASTTPKSINAPNNADNEYLGKGDVLYNANWAFKQNTIVVTEGVPDALTLYPYGIATFGKQVTDVQKAIIISKIKPEQQLLVMLDMDARYQLLQTAQDLYQYHDKTRIVFNPTHKDANSLGREQALKVISNKDNLIVPDAMGTLQFNLRNVI